MLGTTEKIPLLTEYSSVVVVAERGGKLLRHSWAEQVTLVEAEQGGTLRTHAARTGTQLVG
jgi:hypothetical protein